MSLSFAELRLNNSLLKAISKIGFEKPTPVQSASIPSALEGKDLCVCAQTGSGKTAAFLLPTLNGIAENKSPIRSNGPRALILTPTRELAQQIEGNINQLTDFMKWLKYVTLVGGTAYGGQIRALSRPIDIVVATPGRLIDHMKQGRMDFSRLEYLILDEADRMLDMGFMEDIKTIVKATPDSRQTLLFSATLDGIMGKLAQSFTKDALRIDVEHTEKTGKIDEFLYYADDFRHKIRLLDSLLRDTTVNQAVIFTSTKVMTEELADILSENGFPASYLHGDMQQNWRNRTLKNMHNGRTKILVATDVAARGLDVAGITHVFNFDLPKQTEDYVHRIGRTGRAGKSGIAISFAEVKEYVKVHQIEKYVKRKFAESTIEGMEPTRKRSTTPKKSRPYGKKGFFEAGKKDRFGGEKKYGGEKRSNGPRGTGNTAHPGNPARKSTNSRSGKPTGNGRPAGGGRSGGGGRPAGNHKPSNRSR